MFSFALNKTITINRGDDAKFTLKPQKSGSNPLDPEYYVLSGSDAAYLGIMEAGQPFEEAIVKYKFTSADLDEDGAIKIHIKATDTEKLVPGRYFYQFKVVYADPDPTGVLGSMLVDTVIPRKPFIIIE